MSEFRERCRIVATAKPIAISIVIAAMITSSSTCPSTVGVRYHQNAAAASPPPKRPWCFRAKVLS